ncbi:MAG: hypothetical protein HZB59_06750 [Ignavibacteriales bacterium]|nr:hypothetical protein [Ignavibacteriales bacterium]
MVLLLWIVVVMLAYMLFLLYHRFKRDIEWLNQRVVNLEDKDQSVTKQK